MSLSFIGGGTVQEGMYSIYRPLITCQYFFWVKSFINLGPIPVLQVRDLGDIEIAGLVPILGHLWGNSI